MQKHPGFGFKSTAFITPFCTSWTVCNVLRSDRKLYCIGNSPFSPELSSIACIQLNSIRSYNLLAVSSITTRLYGDGSLESQPPLRMSTSFCRFLWLGKASFFRDVLKRFKMSSGLLRTLDFNNSLRMLSGPGAFSLYRLVAVTSLSWNSGTGTSSCYHHLDLSVWSILHPASLWDLTSHFGFHIHSLPYHLSIVFAFELAESSQAKNSVAKSGIFSIPANKIS